MKPNHVYDIPKMGIERKNLKYIPIAIAFCFGLFWIVRHTYNVYADINDISPSNKLTYVWAIVFIIIAQQVFIGWLEKPYKAKTRKQQESLDKLKVVVNIPCYNEDPILLDRALFALSQQTRMPNKIHVVDDGSPDDYLEIKEYWINYYKNTNVEFVWTKTVNRGKRYAQMETFANNDFDIGITLDSDTALERNAIAEGLKPFLLPEVMSVAGFEIAYNLHQSWLTKIGGLHQVIWQITTCSALSVFGDVMVNRGTCAFYRARVLKENVEAYLNETFLGRKVHFSDDTLLTMFANKLGKTVQQPTSFQLTVYPDKFGHSVRQWLRWMRGAAIRDLWRIKYLSIFSYAWWTVFSGWVQFVLGTVAYMVVAFTVEWSWAMAIPFLGIPLLFSYLVALKYLTIWRSDESYWKRLSIFLLAPLVLVRWFLIFKPLRLYGFVTCWQMGWGTRNKVEVRALNNTVEI